MTTAEHATIDRYLERLAGLESQVAQQRQDFNILQGRVNELWLAAIRAGWRLHPEDAPENGLPHHATGGDAALIDVPAIDPPNRHDLHDQQSGAST